MLVSGYPITPSSNILQECAKLADYGFTRAIEPIRNTWGPFEDATFAALAQAEAEASALPLPQALSVMDAFDRNRAAVAIEVLQRLLVDVKTLVFYEAF